MAGLVVGDLSVKFEGVVAVEASLAAGAAAAVCAAWIAAAWIAAVTVAGSAE